MSSNIEIKKKCGWCGKSFTAHKTTTKFCSHRCANLAYKAKKRNDKVKTFEDEYSHALLKQENAERVEFLTPTKAAKLLGICRASVYNYLKTGAITAVQFKGKTLIRRKDIDKLFDEPKPYQKRLRKEPAPITEFYTNDELREKFGVSLSWIFKVGKNENIPKVMRRGKTLWSKKHFDAVFARQQADESITEWYTAEEMRQKFGMTSSAVYSLAYTYKIPKKKVRNEVFYSKRHVDAAKGLAVPAEPEYYTSAEAMERYGLTRDQLYHYIKWHRIPKVQEGRYLKISKKELDALLAPPVL